jgi:hypothetical protein
LRLALADIRVEEVAVGAAPLLAFALAGFRVPVLVAAAPLLRTDTFTLPDVPSFGEDAPLVIVAPTPATVWEPDLWGRALPLWAGHTLAELITPHVPLRAFLLSFLAATLAALGVEEFPGRAVLFCSRWAVTLAVRERVPHMSRVETVLWWAEALAGTFFSVPLPTQRTYRREARNNALAIYFDCASWTKHPPATRKVNDARRLNWADLA